MMEQESFAKSLPSESRHIVNATMAYVRYCSHISLVFAVFCVSNRLGVTLSNMLDLGQGSASPTDFLEREQLYQYVFL